LKNNELAEKIGTSEAFVSMLLAGKRNPSWHIAKKIAKATNSDARIWMDGDVDKMREAMEGE